MGKLYYPAIFHPEEVGYSVPVPDIEGCFPKETIWRKQPRWQHLLSAFA